MFATKANQMKQSVTLLGIESSCDDTAAAVVCGVPGSMKILSSVVFGQNDLHASFGGVVPEIAARAHAERLDSTIQKALDAGGVCLKDLSGIAVTCGPGLIGGVVSGVMMAKGLSIASGKPLYGINHLAGHALTPRLSDGIMFPYLMLLVSGGHCQFLIVHGPIHFERLGGTIDDAPGEAFDKVARLIGLKQPGGPAIETLAERGDAARFAFPRPLRNKPDCNLSFSGLKTAVLRARDLLVSEHGGLRISDQTSLAASFQMAVAESLAGKSATALKQYLSLSPKNPTFCVAGGVAANMKIREMLEKVAASVNVTFLAPPLGLCTDNAAMIAAAGIEQMSHRSPDDMTLSARPRMPLDMQSPIMLGSGKKGAKA